MTNGSKRNALSRIDTGFTLNVYDDVPDSQHPSPQATPTDISFPRLSASPSVEVPPSQLLATSTNLRARNESRKLLSHVLIQLANRNKPSSIIESLASSTSEPIERGFGALAETLREAVKHGIRSDNKTRKRSGSQVEDDEDEENHSTFSTDDTIDLMLQLKDVLTMSISQGWQIFDDSSLVQNSVDEDDFKSSTFRRSRSSFRAGGKRSRSSSPYKGQVHVPELLSLCLSILESIVSEDCRYRVAFPRPSRPPNALQALTLNVAQFLIHCHRHDPRIISQIAQAMIPAFSTFDAQMYPRLLSFFEMSVVRVVLQSLRLLQGFLAQDSTTRQIPDFRFEVVHPDEAPIVSIQIDEVQNDDQPHPRPLGFGAGNESFVIQSTNNPRQSPKIYCLAFLIPPLLSAAFDSFDLPDPGESQTELSTRLSQLIALIANSKLDTYNDLLEITAYRGPKARRLAIASLARLWPRAAGHTVISITSDDMVITWETLRMSCMDYYPILRLNRDQLSGCSFEEISIYHDVLRAQVQLLTNGIGMGSVVVIKNGKNFRQNSEDSDLFELRRVLDFCVELLHDGGLVFSDSSRQFMQDANTSSSGMSIMANWSYLEYASTVIKAPLLQARPRQQGASGFLDVDQSMGSGEEAAEMHTYESVPLSQIRATLEADFGVHSEQAAKFFINHLHYLAFFDKADHSIQPFEDISAEQLPDCIFPLPLGLDLSLNVETLVSSIEACLTDIDLTSNEFGFLLLTRRFWPSGLASEYGLKRLAGKVLSWILDEARSSFPPSCALLSNVHSNVHTCAYRTTILPLFSESLWRNGGDHRAFELTTMCNPGRYRPTFEQDLQVSPAMVETTYHPDMSSRCDGILRSIIKLCQVSAIFSVFDIVFIRWVGTVVQFGEGGKAMPALHRLFVSDFEPSNQRTNHSGDLLPGSPERPPELPDPLGAMGRLASESDIGLSQGLNFLSMAATSGVVISSTSFNQFLALIAPENLNCLGHAGLFIKAVVLSLWMRSLGRQDFQELVAALHSQLSSQISRSLLSGSNASIALSIIRLSLAACLRIYGCERSSIIDSGLVSLSEVDQLPSRRKVAVRGSGVVDPVIVSSEVLTALELYIQSNVEDVACFAAKFLNLFLMESPFMEGFEVDNFILRNGKLVALCVWTVYNMQRDDVAAVRTSLLLRSLLIDSEPFQEILNTNMDPTNVAIEERLLAINRLFRVVTDVTSPAFGVEGRQWRTSVIDIFISYFSALWADPAEEVRLAVRSSSVALLPPHLNVITQCWNESLLKSPIPERIRLLGFLIQLRPHFPSWKVLSWDSMIDTLLQYDQHPKFSESNVSAFSEKEKIGYRLSTVDPDLAHLRVSILLLAMQMIADGLEIDSFSLMKIKVQFVQITGFTRISVLPTLNGQSFYLQYSDIPEISESAYPCIEEIPHVLDAAHYTTLPYPVLGIANEEDKTANVLVGSAFLDTSLCMIGTLRDLSSLPVLTLKALIETLYIILHKYDFEDRTLQHYQPLVRRAVLRTVELLSKDISYELRQLALSIAQASINKWHTFLGPVIAPIIELVATEVASQSKNSQDTLVVNGKLLIGNTLHTFCNNGLLLSLMRRPLNAGFFVVLKQVLAGSGNGNDANTTPNPLCDQLLRDTLLRAVECDAGSFPAVFQNINTFIEVVCFQGYTAELMAFVGQQLTQMARRMSDGSTEGIDPSPLILIPVVLIQNNKKHTKELLPYVDTVLRVALNRLSVSTFCLTSLIKALPRQKTQEPVPGVLDLVAVLFELLLDGLRMKTKMLPATINSLIDSLISMELYTSPPPPAITHGNILRNLTDDAFMFLQNHAWHEENIDNDFRAVMSTGRLVLQAANDDRRLLQKFTEPTSEKTSRPPLSIRSWNILLLASLLEGKDEWKSMLYAEFTAFANVYSAMLRSYVHSGVNSLAAATNDVNQAHVATKLWLMAVSSIPATQGGENLVNGVWNELWAAYQSFLGVLETEAQFGLYPTLISLALTSVVDLLLYTRSLRMSLALDISGQIAILNRLKSLNRGDSSANKITRAIKSMSEPPPEIANNVLLDQIARELVAAEKIKVIEGKRVGDGRGGGGGYRKEGW
ncbi:hypothetical protein NLJ89_g1005 [Agrocybe chaxingu]|uniref:Uncharacterized protein n=1 Tax=Agrocybe chaxingu TaxID=84603 RepID=A0A9W8N0U0_9AGAR|nr:hypothetical protein NLJ89_g1005 [Agrocybe chaxingu]